MPLGIMEKEGVPSQMASHSESEMGVNSWLEDELYQQYLRDRTTVDESWKHVFEEPRPAANGATAGPAKVIAPSPELSAGEQLLPLRGTAGRLAENMSASVAIPLATSQRTIAVKVMDENRRIVNQHRTLLGRGKVSYTHLIGWAIVKALEEIPALNAAYAEQDGHPFRLTPARINLGTAVDVSGKDGARSLMVPNIKAAGGLPFQEYLNAFDDLVARAHRPARAGQFPADHHSAHRLRHGRYHGVEPAADARPGRHRGVRRHRLPGQIPGRGAGD